jgi:hypothetical protein
LKTIGSEGDEHGDSRGLSPELSTDRVLDGEDWRVYWHGFPTLIMSVGMPLLRNFWPPFLSTEPIQASACRAPEPTFALSSSSTTYTHFILTLVVLTRDRIERLNCRAYSIDKLMKRRSRTPPRKGDDMPDSKTKASRHVRDRP